MNDKCQAICDWCKPWLPDPRWVSILLVAVTWVVCLFGWGSEVSPGWAMACLILLLLFLHRNITRKLIAAVVDLIDRLERVKIGNNEASLREKAITLKDATESPSLEAPAKKLPPKAKRAEKQIEAVVQEQLQAIDPNLLSALGDAKFTEGNYEEALKFFTLQTTLQPSNSVAWDDKGASLSRLNRNAEALAAYEEEIELDPRHANAWYNKGVSLGKLGRDREALAAFEKEIGLDPSHANAWHNKGYALGELGRNEEALAAYERAIEFGIGGADTWYDLACLKNRLKHRKDEVLSDLRQAIELDEGIAAVARKDEDFESLWNDPDFLALTETEPK